MYNRIHNNIMCNKYVELLTHWIYNDIIIIKPDFDKDINLIQFNNKITSLVFTDYNKLKYAVKNINDSKYYNKKYKLLSKFNNSIDNLPPYILNLNFSLCFNQEVNNLPQNLQNLTFGNCFNQLVDNLPQNMHNLTFGSGFNQSVDNLPQNLQNLTFGYHFNKLVNNLPQTLLNITFGVKFNQLLDDLPNSIISINFKHLINNLNYNFNKQLCCLPNSIISINLPINYDQEIKHIPLNLKNISCSSSYKYIDELKKNENMITIDFIY